MAVPGGGLSKGMQEMVRNAVAEMRRYYSRKVVDVLIRVTRQSLDSLRKRFMPDAEPGMVRIKIKFVSTDLKFVCGQICVPEYSVRTIFLILYFHKMQFNFI